MSRRTPQEDAVREQMRERSPEDGADEGATATEAAGAVDESAEPVAADGGNGKPAEDQATAEPAEPAEANEPAEATDERPEPEPEPDPLAKAEAERDEYLELARRTQADFENYRKRVAKDLTAAGSRAKLGLVRDVLPVMDNLERALASAQNGDAGLADGVRLVLAALQGVLTREGVVALEPAGERFDPTVHEALSTRAQEGAEPGVVLDVVEKGYRMADTVIRPARVVVSA